MAKRKAAAPAQSEQPLPFHSAVARQAEPGQEFVSVSVGGETLRLVADEQGIVRPQSPEEVRLADLHSLPPIQEN